MDKCKQCSHEAKSIYHVGKCPKEPYIEWIPIDDDTYKQYTRFRAILVNKLHIITQ